MSSEQENKGVELSEQTPLNPTHDVTVTTETAAEGGPTTTIINEKKRWFFTKKTKGPKAEEGSAVAPSKDVESGVPATGNDNKKKCHWWQRKPCSELTQTEQQLSYGVNLVQRDDRNLQSIIDLDYQDIYGEPDSVHSINGIWRTNAAVFQAVRSFFYKVFSFIIAIPLAVIFGVLFALFSALSVFVLVPAGVLLSIPVGWVFKLWSWAVRSIFEPVFNSLGLMFSNVKISRYGLNTDTTAVLNA